MSESSSSECVDQFSCSVCLDLLKEPVTIPCGHSYCMSCITDCWSLKEQGPPYRCPQCRESFSQRPLLKKNTLIAEMMETLQKTTLQTPAAAATAVDCDVCTTEKNRAVKSCLQCLASFCQTHLQLHYESPAFMKHKLVDASRHIQENICPSHGRPLEIYCQDDHQCICCLCIINSHKTHSVVSVDSEWINKKKELEKIAVERLKLIENREKGLWELSEAVKSFKSSADEAVEKMEKVFTELICSLEKKRSEIKEQIRAQEKTETDRAEQLHQHLHQELTQLRKTQAEIHKLLTTEDQIHCLKSCESVCVLPTFEEVPFSPHSHLSFKDLSISAFREALEDACRQQTDAISREVSNVHTVKPSEPKTYNDFLQYFYQPHLDPNTAHKNLILSEENRRISYSDTDQQYPDHPERFAAYCNVLCKEGLTGRCYWEVNCHGKIWAVAVCYKGISRKGNTDDNILGYNKQSWRLSRYQKNIFFVHNSEEVSIPVFHSSRIGVYLDHRAGILSFYSVSKTMTLIHKVQTTFTELLYPAFGLGECSIRIIKQKRFLKDQK
ncbi:E3 ubiquitin/ISG15 ligase TRIM25 [Danio rerio]|uniref:E3 ubiquitin/ISG15 ligase TRIM25 n=1 Tax=Danio rerio TaxID=7955 RepID=A0A8M1RKP5_DANRE|nr:E3 ubiquitin/ISG15 ligase TRIM25 isoform X2 [Danio rerio]XP_005157864.1 E3 ubiquitin/ISG15 ligase TRIM25 isoform X2 [Danio rerio]|eukprot:XP_002664744.1 E3 ubiquitin/ISG15 ligase TRIM25 isoform X2 [Danio rerio]